MIKELMHDPIFLAGKSEVATKEDLQVAQDLLDTLAAHSHECVGMAANMIGELKRIIVFQDGARLTVMLDPVIKWRSHKTYDTEEGCLSLAGMRKTTRWQEIDVSFQDMDFKPRQQHFSGWAAQIIQHEVDHCNGILI